MERQLLLSLDPAGRERQQRLWAQLPKESRAELVALYAMLIAQAARVLASPEAKEQADETGDR